jgi:hypothetical protein
MNSSYYANIKDIENKLQNLFFSGNDQTLNRVRLVLKELESKLNKSQEFGFHISVTGRKSKVILEPEDKIGMNKIQLHSVQKLITYIDKLLPPQQTETKTDIVKEEGAPIFTNNFDKIKPTEIYKHFKAGLVEKGYLTEQELNEFLKVAFELKTIPEKLFKIKDAPNKATIESVFYKYYKNVAGKIHGKQNQYAALLGDYFEGYKTTTVSSNFSKSVY